VVDRAVRDELVAAQRAHVTSHFSPSALQESLARALAVLPV